MLASWFNSLLYAPRNIRNTACSQDQLKQEVLLAALLIHITKKIISQVTHVVVLSNYKSTVEKKKSRRQ